MTAAPAARLANDQGRNLSSPVLGPAGNLMLMTLSVLIVAWEPHGFGSVLLAILLSLSLTAAAVRHSDRPGLWLIVALAAVPAVFSVLVAHFRERAR